MFNSPVLDIAIGLIFIFLLYSLLATSIHEAIATVLSLRASMLRRSIIENMLSDTPLPSRLRSLGKGVANFMKVFLENIRLRKPARRDSLGWKFYAHPVIKNYGESGMFPLPSYIPRDNFSAVLIDILLKDFNDNLREIATLKLHDGSEDDNVYSVENDLKQLSEGHKIRELLQFHLYCYTSRDKHCYFIQCDICRILEMHLRNSLYDMELFSERIEKWFDDSMGRVSGWYKRQTQFILFLIGFTLAFVFNVDTIEIAGRLTTDKDAREQLVNLATKAADSYKDDPRVKNLTANAAQTAPTEEEIKELSEIKAEYSAHTNEAKRLLSEDIKDANNVLSVGWNEFGRNDIRFLSGLRNSKKGLFGKSLSGLWNDSQKKAGLQHRIDSVKLAHNLEVLKLEKLVVQDTSQQNIVQDDSSLSKISTSIEKLEAQRLQTKIILERKKSAAQIDSLKYAAYYSELRSKYPTKMKMRYVAHTVNGVKLLGFLIMAFAICLGAPFWFDLLNKMVRIRGAGTKEGTEKTDKSVRSVMGTSSQPLAVTVNNQQSGEEAVG